MVAVYKIPESVLVVIHTPAAEVLLLERADHPGFWQSVTGSRAAPEEPLAQTGAREVAEETGFDCVAADLDDWRLTHRYAIYPHWRHRYAPGVNHNVEHVFGLRVAARFDPLLAPREHLRAQWLPWRAAAEACFSWTNAQAIRRLAAGGVR
ncbi:MAG: dihydroneopterin triphosphate diphosphatase [Betaproteobacteria bacterium]